MSNTIKETDRGALDAQREHGQATFASTPEMFGREPSDAARQAAELFSKEGKRKVLELGCGQGRDALFLTRSGFVLGLLGRIAEEWRKKGGKGRAGRRG